MKSTCTFLLLFLLAAFSSQAQVRYFHAILQGTQEVPSNGSSASGVAVLWYDMGSNKLQLEGDYQGLAANITGSHIHGPALPGANAGVLYHLTNSGGTTGTLSGIFTLTDQQEVQLLADSLYINLHNATFPGGEIRGQIVPNHATETVKFNGRLQGSQEVPPNGSTGSGYFNIIFDKSVQIAYVTGSFMGLTTAATAGHIHRGAAGSNGPVLQGLSVSNAMSGTLHGVVPLNTAQRDSMLAGETYVNIHNATYPGGELRGQVNQLNMVSFFTAVLSGAEEVPTNPSTAMGTVILKYNPATMMLDVTGDYQGLTTNITGAHIHGPATPGNNANVVVGLTHSGGTTGTLTGTATLTMQQQQDLYNGLYYVNVHSGTYPGGEIRGQLNSTTQGETQYMQGMLQGSQETGDNTSPGTGNVTVILDKVTRQVYVTGSFSGLSSAATAAHVHRGAAGQAGPVVLGLSVSNATSGTVTGSGMVSQAVADSIIMGFSYVNIHNAPYPAGALRAQLGNQVLPVAITFFNGYKNRNEVVLNWQIAQEIAVDRYELEQHDAPTGNWIRKKALTATGLSNGQSYSAIDIPLASTNGYALYRLKIIDKDGRVSYSNTIRIHFDRAEAAINILNNPVRGGTLRFTITGLQTDVKAEIAVVDYNGRVVKRQAQNAGTTHSIDVANLAPGMYKLVVRLNGTMLQQSFIR